MTYIMRIAIASLVTLAIQAAIPAGQVTDFARLIGPDRSAKKAFDDAIAADLPLVIKFYLIGCAPCKATDAAYAKMAHAFKGKANFITLDVIKYEEIAKQFNIKTLPSWAIFAQKRKLTLIKGSKNMADVQKFLARYFQLMTAQTTAP